MNDTFTPYDVLQVMILIPGAILLTKLGVSLIVVDFISHFTNIKPRS